MKHYFFFWNVCLCTLLLCFGPCCGQVFAENAGEVRPGKCAITSGGHTYRPSGCLIRKGTDEGLGWRIIEKKDGSPLLDEILTVSIVETGPGTAEVSGLTQGGINSRWGEAKRYIMTMNRFARLLVKIREADSGIEVALTKRFDTLTKMLEVTRAYARHEADTLGNIVKMRQGMNMTQRSDANSQMDVLREKINVLAEAYPELRSSDSFRALQTSITDVEEDLQAVRRIYNMNVSQFNQMLVTWPDSIVGHIHGHKNQDFFKAEKDKKQDVAIHFFL